MSSIVTRRTFLRHATLAGAAAAVPLWWASAAVAQSDARPALPFGVQSGDVTPDGAVIWSATDRPARLMVEYATSEGFGDVRRVVGPAALPEAGYTAQAVLTGLPAGQDIFYRVSFQDLGDLKSRSMPVTGRFKTPPADGRDVTFVWSGDTAGQGWGINLEWGGMKIYETMRRLEPDFFVHSGDMIYADGPIQAEVALPAAAPGAMS
jgi:alkaline phosphatase D